MNVGNRSRAAVVRAPVQPGHYRALANMARLCPRFPDVLRRYLTAQGDYPYRGAVRTPLGVVAPTLHSSHDVSTLVEVFCRLDYGASDDVGVVVDIGSNIGISALYFLTRNATSRCYLFEPDPRNCERLAHNLAAFRPRWEIEQAAVALEAGTAEFGVEETGRYGGIGIATERSIRVTTHEINAALERILAQEAGIDLLKIDVEGLETDLVAAIRPELLERIGCIYFETNDPADLHPDRYHHSYVNQTNRLLRRNAPLPRTEPRPRAPSEDEVGSTLSSRFPKIAVVHEWLTLPGGSEKVVLALLGLFPQATVYTSIYDPEPWPELLASRPVHTSFLDRIPGARSIYPRLLPLMNTAFESFDLSGFDLVLSSNHACAKNVLTTPETLHVCYCHTPMRYAWEPEFLRDEAIGPLARVAMPVIAGRLRRDDLAGAERPDAFVANSSHVAARIEKYYRRDAYVVHPPVDVGPLLERPRDVRDYYLVLGRLVPYKRADVAVAACERLGRPLKVAGAGRAMPSVRALAGAHTELLGHVDDEAIPGLLSGARALLFPGQEDFGIVPVEAQAAGVPVIAYGVGGVRDSVIDGETGLLYADPSVDGLAAAILDFERREFDEAAVRDNARRFGLERFVAGMTEVLDRLEPLAGTT